MKVLYTIIIQDFNGLLWTGMMREQQECAGAESKWFSEQLLKIRDLKEGKVKVEAELLNPTLDQIILVHKQEPCIVNSISKCRGKLKKQNRTKLH